MGHSGKHLSQRTIQGMIDLAAEGATTQDIAALFGCRPETVRNHLPADLRQQTHNMSEPIIGHGVKEFREERRALLSQARARDPEAIRKLERMGVTGWWTKGEGTHVARRGFSAASCMVL